ncbi:MAG: HAD family hydrolase [Candidatus Thermoplasmatota archaeon]|jgi:histidinol-phosphate phosphatase family protein|nr:HAD family hydrolase [Candidatus Thermoplasmatota archaeon]
MLKPAIFTDRDGTLNRDCPYCHNVEDLVIYPDAVDVLREYQGKGFLVVMITNQSGINRGYFTEREFTEFNHALKLSLEDRGVRIDAIYFCPHRPDENCDCRKPKTALIERAVNDLNIDLERSVILGDRDDIEGELARKLGIKPIILKRGEVPEFHGR